MDVKKDMTHATSGGMKGDNSMSATGKYMHTSLNDAVSPGVGNCFEVILANPFTRCRYEFTVVSFQLLSSTTDN
jgi:hypothetical protein